MALLLLQAVAVRAATVTRIAAGYDFSLFVKSDGSLWAMGANGNGQLGDGTTTSHSTPEQIVSSGVTAIAAGNSHSLYLKSDGSLWAMGINGSGQLGDGTTTDHHTPEQIVASGVTAIAAGSFHSLFVKSDGSLWAMGYNGDGELGDGTTTSHSTPERIVASGVTAIAGGASHSLYLKSDGSLWAMGYNGNGQLGDGTTTSHSTPEQIVAGGVTAIAAGGGRSVENPQLLGFSLFVKSDGSLWAMGNNDSGELGDGTTTGANLPEQIVSSGVTAIAAGANNRDYFGLGAFSLFVKSDGSLWGMGFNADGELGDGTTTDTSSPERIVAGGVTAIAAGAEDSLFLKSDGSLWGMGFNSSGELGDGTTTGTNSPEQIVGLPPCGSSVDIWISSTGGKWETAANWSPCGVAPSIADSADLITNAGNNTVTIDQTTAGSFPSTMAVSNLTISANALQVTNAIATEFHILNNFTLTGNWDAECDEFDNGN